MSLDEESGVVSGDGAAGHAGRIDPQAMTVTQAAKVLSAVGGGRVTEEMIRRHVEAGAPVAADGRINLVHYAAWLNKDTDREDDGA